MNNNDPAERMNGYRVGMAIKDQLADEEYLAPDLWEPLRQRLQAMYRRATGEKMAVLGIIDGGVETVVEPIDPRTGRPLGDHGTAIQAIEFATINACFEAYEFLKCWMEGDLDYFPEFYEWLKKKESKNG